MPISQKTVLFMYGELCTLADQAERLHLREAQLDLFTDAKKDALVLRSLIRLFLLDVQRVRQQALDQMLEDEPGLDANPLTGRIS